MERINKILTFITLIVILCSLVTLFIIGGRVQRCGGESVSDTVISVKYDTIWRRDTFSKTNLLVVRDEIIRYDTIRKDTILEYVKKAYKDTILCQGDSAIVEIITQGYEHKIDSLYLDLRRQDITRTITIEKWRRKRWNVGPQVGVGVDVLGRKPSVYVGFGVQYNL